jgi:uncharacterized protein
MKTADRTALMFLDLYRRIVAPLLPPACRFVPSCSEYARQAIERYGIRRGGLLAVRRLASCHPLHKGGFDPLK